MNILILGGTYFIGRVLTERLSNANFSITLLNRGNKNNIFPEVEFIRADRGDKVEMIKKLSKRYFDVVIDLSGYKMSEVDIAIEALEGNIQQYIFCSSIAVCRQPPTCWPISESHAKCRSFNDSAYGYDKYLSEKLILEKGEKQKFNTTIVRPVYVYGPYDYDMRIRYIYERIFNKRQVFIHGNGENIIQFGYVFDLVEVIIRLFLNQKAYGETFNVSGDELTTINQLIEKIAFILDIEVEIVAGCDDNRGHEVSSLPTVNRFASTKKIVDVLGILPKTSLCEGLKKSTNWYLKGDT